MPPKTCPDAAAVRGTGVLYNGTVSADPSDLRTGRGDDGLGIL
jgi:hypothetical protein